MTVDIKEKDKQDVETKKRTSYNLPEVKVNKSEKVDSKLPTSTISFPSEEFRLSVTKTYKDLGYTTLKSYLLALMQLSMEDEQIKKKLKI